MQTKEYSFKGIVYKVACKDEPLHPTWYSYEDESSVRAAKWLIEPGDVVFDIGAAYGSYTMPALASGAVYSLAWSPQGMPGDFSEAEYFVETLRLNGWLDKCEIFESGIYDRKGWINTFTEEFTVDRPSPFVPEAIQVEPLDPLILPKLDYLKSIGKRFWFKLDVEGAEVHVLKSASQTMEALRPWILVENHNFKGPKEQEVRALLTSLNYTEISTTPYHSVSHSLYMP